MSLIIAWLLFALGVGHIIYGLFQFIGPLSEAVAAGFIGQFNKSEIRRTAFWFVIFGPLVMLAGHIAIRAVTAGDLELVRVIGLYALAVSIVGFAAIPKSGFLPSLVVSVFLVAVGFGWLA